MFGFSPSGGELVLLMVVALMLFGRNLPEVAMNLGKGLREFQSGLKGMKDDFTRSTTASPQPSSYTYDDSSNARPTPEEELDQEEDDVPRFELPESPPVMDDEAQESTSNV